MFDFFDDVLEWFDWVIDTVAALVDFVWTIITGTLDLIEMIPEATKTLTDSLENIPSIVAGFAGATITVCVIFMIVGREHGGNSN